MVSRSAFVPSATPSPLALSILLVPWYPGVIDSTQPGPSGELVYKVAFLTFGNSATLAGDKLRSLQDPFENHVDPAKIKVLNHYLCIDTMSRACVCVSLLCLVGMWVATIQYPR